MTLESRETLDYNRGAHAAGMLLSFITLQAVSPFTIYTQKMSHSIEATLVLPGGRTNRFTVRAEGHTTQSGPNLEPARVKLDKQLREATSQGLVERIHEVIGLD